MAKRSKRLREISVLEEGAVPAGAAEPVAEDAGEMPAVRDGSTHKAAVPVRVPVYRGDELGYVARDVSVSRLPVEFAEALTRVRIALRRSNAEWKPGTPVVSNTDAVRWLLAQVAQELGTRDAQDAPGAAKRA